MGSGRAFRGSGSYEAKKNDDVTHNWLNADFSVDELCPLIAADEEFAPIFTGSRNARRPRAALVHIALMNNNIAPVSSKDKCIAATDGALEASWHRS